MLKTLNKLTIQLPKLLALIAILTITSLVLGTNKAEPATINVSAGNQNLTNADGYCSLGEAIANINDQANSWVDCVAVGSAYGTSDTINMASGTLTLQDAIGYSTRAVDIKGAGISSTLVDLNGYEGISFDNNNADFSASDFKVENGLNWGIGLGDAYNVNISNVEIENSDMGMNIPNALHVDLNSVYIHDNVMADPGSNAGAWIAVNAKVNSDVPYISVVNSRFINNQSLSQLAGLGIQINNAPSNSANIILQASVVSGNTSEYRSGVSLGSYSTSETNLLVDAVTVANNLTQPTIAASDPNPNNPAYISGFFIEVTNLADGQNFRNVTVANNTVINNVDYHTALAGFLGGFVTDGDTVNIINTTVVGNHMTQSLSFPNPLGRIPSFEFVNYGLGLQNIYQSGSGQNNLIADNLYNGTASSCRNDVDKVVFGGSGLLDLTPTNLGNNITDDPNCTGYTVVPNILSTLGPLQDNGGPVPTIALLSGSPAIGSAAQVLGISTDARGVARPSTPDVGAYQTVLGTNTNNSDGSNPGGSITGVGVPNTGLGRNNSNLSPSAIILMVITSMTMLSSLAIRIVHIRVTNA